jgi:hypothetical protein
MVTFMFWNVGGNSSADLVATACHEYQIDVLILAESNVSSTNLLGKLNSRGEFRFLEFDLVPSTIKFFFRLPAHSLKPIFDDGRVAIRNLTPPLGQQLLLVACHLPSKLHREESDQYYRLRSLRSEISRAESRVGHQNSLVIGDLNLNPFEASMTAPDGLHAVMDKRIARRAARRIQDATWDYFYNPMWSRLGDESSGPPGTYYYSGGRLIAYYWHTFDQVLLRPSLLKYYKKSNLRVLTKVGSTDLLNSSGLPGPFSDHLPLVLKLDIEKGL